VRPAIVQKVKEEGNTLDSFTKKDIRETRGESERAEVREASPGRRGVNEGLGDLNASLLTLLKRRKRESH